MLCAVLTDASPAFNAAAIAAGVSTMTWPVLRVVSVSSSESCSATVRVRRSADPSPSPSVAATAVASLTAEIFDSIVPAASSTV